ncbi:UDP-N-acetylglucosamine 2-epimerase [Alphaproteobacteria bacterium]|nr:UDP-N-acetylglucosamine 2-epimerase [Alphaproteobacteria bacterium]
MMNAILKKKKIIFFTGNRAEYGLLSPIIRELSSSTKYKVSILVAGSHLEADYGSTIKEIKSDNFKYSKLGKIERKKNSFNSNSLAISDGIKKISDYLLKRKPDYFFVYGDRYEAFSAVIASTQMNIITCHIEGGDLTEGGALDDSVRHAITKLSHLHFPTNIDAKNRLIQLGEEKWRVHNFGFSAIDKIKQHHLALKGEIKNKFNFNFNFPIILFTQHSVTTEYNQSKKQINQSIKALKILSKENYQILITYPNNDMGGDKIVKELLKLSKLKNIIIKKSIGSYFYHGILNLRKRYNYKIICVGNSSSGIKETPYFKCPSINIGSRQSGRLRSKNVIDVGYNSEEIVNAVKKSLFDITFINKIKNSKNPYGGGNTSKKFRKFFENVKISKNKLLRKRMISFK